MISCIIVMVKLQKFGLCLTVKFVSMAAALLFLLAAAFPSISSFADFRQDLSWSYDSVRDVQVALDHGSAALVDAALSAITVDLTIRSVEAMAHSDLLDVLISGAGSPPPDYQFLGSLFQFLNRETIKIRPNSVTIGGVEYSDVWLPHDCADKFRTNAFDFITRYNIASESTGTFASGEGNVDGIPVFDVDGVLRTQTYVAPYQAGSSSLGNGFFKVIFNSPGQPSSTAYVSYQDSLGVSHSLSSSWSSSRFPISVYLAVPNFSSCTAYSTPNGMSTNRITVSFDSSLYVRSSFDFDFVAGTIPVVPLAASDGLRLRVPSSYVSGLPQILDPSSSSYDTDLTSLTDSLTTAGEAGEIADPAFEAWDAPVPGSGTIADEPYSSLSGSLNGIQSVINSISSSVSGIADSIVGADSSFFGNVVSALAVPFEPVFAVFRSGVSIWSYVVSWIGTISAPFSWSLSALGSAGGYFLSPIYAAAAAAVVLAVYKKFGR